MNMAFPVMMNDTERYEKMRNRERAFGQGRAPEEAGRIFAGGGYGH